MHPRMRNAATGSGRSPSRRPGEGSRGGGGSNVKRGYRRVVPHRERYAGRDNFLLAGRADERVRIFGGGGGAVESTTNHAARLMAA